MTRQPFDLRERLVLLRVLVIGPAGYDRPWFALDTGSSRSVIADSVLMRIGIDPQSIRRSVRMNTLRSTEAGGEVQLVRVSALGHHLDQPKLICTPMNPRRGYEGLLGLDFFRDQILTLDFARGRITLGPPRAWWHVW